MFTAIDISENLCKVFRLILLEMVLCIFPVHNRHAFDVDAELIDYPVSLGSLELQQKLIYGALCVFEQQII